ncbi:magnesium and cobalt transport protein CorA [Nocardia aurantia]|uniref:Cobalt/magnesium transport protein CorA n=1 Tax=Nocardia aurantia TaxID=2585199 RepID=A0A7K0DK72_9NOCA|nr:magnesium and cobalt transport protein CorA [Nocardia aurantia]MQY26001.1 Cobalt/magnesium transport protein CorA [Nocardia aurantia]
MPDPAVVDCAVYVDGERLPGSFGPDSALAEVRERGSGFVWLGLHEPDERQMAEIAEMYGLHPLAAEDAARPRQRPKLERYDDTLVVVMRTVAYMEHDMHTVSEIVLTGQILVFVAGDFVIAVRHGDHTGLSGVRRELEADPDRLRRGPGAVLHAIADYVVDSYIDVAQAVEQDVDAMEEEIFTPGTTMAIEPIYQLKREVVEMRRAVAPFALPLQMLIQKEMPLPKEVRRYLRDVADHHTVVTEQITIFDESLSAMISAALAKTAVQQNTDMRKISALIAMGAVPTMIAGIYGMNFEHMPELQQVWGYPVVLTVMVVLCAGLLILFRRSKWL